MRKIKLWFITLMCLFSIAVGAQNVTLTALSGTYGFSNESFDALVDGKSETKWCVGSFQEAYIVSKTSEAIVPTNYSLVTGSDTGKFPDRNWKNWSIYAANFTPSQVLLRSPFYR